MKPLHALALLFATFILPALPTQAGAPKASFQAPGFYRTVLGNLEITALSDGTHPFPVQTVMQAPPAQAGEARPLLQDARPAEAASRLAADDLKLPIVGSINAFLINTGKRLLLIDTGAGDLYGKCCGRLVANIKAAGYKPDEVDDVFLTHLHADHVGGLMLSGNAVYTNAVVHVSRRDAGYWLDPQNETKAPSFLRPMFEDDRKVLNPSINAGRFEPFDYGTDVVPGITPIATPGHTPGHTSYLVDAGAGMKFVVWGDIVHVAQIQFPDPAITVTYDSDADEAVTARERLFSKAARNGFSRRSGTYLLSGPRTYRSAQRDICLGSAELRGIAPTGGMIVPGSPNLRPGGRRGVGSVQIAV